MIKNITLGICYLGLFAAVILMATQLSDSAYQSDQNRQAQNRLVETGLGDELIFPDGWQPVECESESKRDNNMNDCIWVCQPEDGRAIYRYCTPTIQSSSSE